MKAFLLVIALSTGASASTIISQDGGGLISAQYAVFAGEAMTTSWTSLSAYDNVNISVTLSAGFNNSETVNSGDAYLTTSIGPGTTVSSQIAHSIFSFAPTATEEQIFSGLTLSAGTYFLTLFSNTELGGAWDATYTPAVLTVDIGTSQDNQYFSNSVSGGPNPSYAPGGAFSNLTNPGQLLYRVEGELTASPEPSTFILLGAGTLLAVFRRKRSR